MQYAISHSFLNKIYRSLSKDNDLSTLQEFEELALVFDACNNRTLSSTDILRIVSAYAFYSSRGAFPLTEKNPYIKDNLSLYVTLRRFIVSGTTYIADDLFGEDLQTVRIHGSSYRVIV